MKTADCCKQGQMSSESEPKQQMLWAVQLQQQDEGFYKLHRAEGKGDPFHIKYSHLIHS